MGNIIGSVRRPNEELECCHTQKCTGNAELKNLIVLRLGLIGSRADSIFGIVVGVAFSGVNVVGGESGRVLAIAQRGHFWSKASIT